MWGDRRRAWICFTIATVVIGWSVFAFGTPQDIVERPDVIITQDDVIFPDIKVTPVRTIAAWATGVGAIVCLILLPGRGRFPRVPWTLAIAACVLLLLGWFMVANAWADHNLEDYQFTPLDPLLEWAPGSIARSSSLKAMVELSFVLLALLAAVRISEGSGWRSLFALLAILGAAVALVGMFHKAAGAPTVYWMNDESQPGQTFFAPFVYNANAGAFMNMCMPIAMGLSLASVGDDRKRSVGICWALVAALTAAGVVVAASKGAIIVLVLTVPVFLLWNRGRLQRIIRNAFVQRGRRIERLVLLGSFALLLFSLVAIGITFVVFRWNEFFGRFYDTAETDITGRLRIMELMAEMAGRDEGSWHGFGPGSFRHLVAHFTVGKGDELDGQWIFGHCDPLQTAVEWGWAGAAAWLVIGAGAVVSGLLLLRRKHLLEREDVPLVRGAVLALAMVGLHSCQDFPLSIYALHLTAMLLCGVCWGLYANRRRAWDHRQKSRS